MRFHKDLHEVQSRLHLFTFTIVNDNQLTITKSVSFVSNASVISAAVTALNPFRSRQLFETDFRCEGRKRKMQEFGDNDTTSQYKI